VARDNRIPSPLSDAANPKPGALGVWDRFALDGQVLPGRADVDVEQGPSIKLDDRSAAGSDGWTTVDKGTQPTKFTVTLELWEPAQLEDWLERSEELSRQLVNRAGGSRNAPRVYHPKLAALCCDRAKLHHVGALKHLGRGLYTVALRFMQYKPPSRPAHSQTVQAGPVTDPTDPAVHPNGIINGDGTRPPAARNTAPPARH
jgi:hypothetical protein